jgi:hypothetical protein
MDCYQFHPQGYSHENDLPTPYFHGSIRKDGEPQRSSCLLTLIDQPGVSVYFPSRFRLSILTDRFLFRFLR